MELSDQLHAPATLLPVKSPQYLLERRLWVDSGAGLDAEEKRKFLPSRESNPDRRHTDRANRIPEQNWGKHKYNIMWGKISNINDKRELRQKFHVGSCFLLWYEL
jgi:hypothetical protein